MLRKKDPSHASLRSAFRMTRECSCGALSVWRYVNFSLSNTNLSSRAEKAHGGITNNEPRDLAAQPLSIRKRGNASDYKVNFATQKRSFTCLARSAFRMTRKCSCSALSVWRYVNFSLSNTNLSSRAAKAYGGINTKIRGILRRSRFQGRSVGIYEIIRNILLRKKDPSHASLRSAFRMTGK